MIEGLGFELFANELTHRDSSGAACGRCGGGLGDLCRRLHTGPVPESSGPRRVPVHSSEAGRGAERLPAGAAAALRRPSSWPEKTGQNRRNQPARTSACHRLIDGSELGFAPVASCRPGDHVSAANKSRAHCGPMAASRDLDGDAKLDRTVTSITSRVPTQEAETKLP